MYITFICYIFLFGGVGSPPVAQQSDQEAIYKIMNRQISCWNQGDIDCFMEGYWQSDALMFISKNGITYGYDQIKARYIRNYPDRKAMGQLNFDIVQLQPLGKDAYLMVGKWMLKREEDDLGGYFTLLFRSINGAWVIVQDHTS